MKTILILCVRSLIAAAILLRVNLFAGDEKEKIVRDTNGKVVAIINQTATGVTVRNASGAVVESREKSGNTLIVRDTAGAVIRKEDQKADKDKARK